MTTPREDAIAALLRVLDEWTDFYGPIDGEAGHPEKYMTQLDHGSDEYEVRISVVECARAALAAAPETPPQYRNTDSGRPDIDAVMREAVAKGYYKSDIDAYLASPETAEALARALVVASQQPGWHVENAAFDARLILAAMRETGR